MDKKITMKITAVFNLENALDSFTEEILGNLRMYGEAEIDEVIIEEE